jgi:LacI family transcriptional regulator
MARSQRILLLVEPNTSYGRKVLKGIASFAQMRKYWVFEFELLAGVQDMLNRGISHADGIIIRGAYPDWLAAVVATGIPAVNVSSEVPDSPLPTVASDNAAIGAMAADHLLSRGFRKFACCGFAGQKQLDDRMEAFRQRVTAAGHQCFLPPPEGRPFEAMFYEDQVGALRQWLKQLPRPTAMFATNDEFGRLVIQTCREIDVHVPEDIAVLGVDNDEVICELSNPPLSSIERGAERIGYEAAKLLAKVMTGGAAPSRPMLLGPVKVVTRRSSDTQAIDEPLVASAIRFIWDHVEERLDVDDVVKHVGVSRRWLEVCFGRTLGRSPAAEIRRAQIEHAKKLLVETDMLMPSVAAASGFTDAKLLIAVFRREVGMTPTQFRRDFRLT